MNNIVIVNHLLSNIDKPIGASNDNRIGIVKLGSDQESLDPVENVNLESNQNKPCKVKVIKNNVNKEMDKYMFNEFSVPFGPLICEKILEARALLNSQKAKLSYCQSINSDEKSFDLEQSITDREQSGLLDYDNADTITTDKIINLKQKLHSIIRKHIENDIKQIIEIILCSDIAELEDYVKDENILLLKIKEIVSLIEDKNEKKISDNRHFDTDLYSCDPIYKEEENDVSKKLHSQIELSEFGKYLNTENFKRKTHLCAKLYPFVAKHAGQSTENLMEKLLELDNAVLHNLLTDEMALQKKVDVLLQSELSTEFINKLGFYGMDAKMKINNVFGNINNQLNELGKIQSVIMGLQNSMANYSQFLSTLTAHKHHILNDLEHIMQGLHKVGASSNAKISAYSESTTNVNSNVISNELPANPMYPTPIIQPNSMIFQPNFLLRPNFNAPNPFLLNTNRLGFLPFFNNGLRPEHPIYSSQNNINTSFLYHNNYCGLDVNELLKSNPSWQNLNQTTENSVSDETTNSEEMDDKDNCDNELISSDENYLEKTSIINPIDVTGMENIDRVEVDSVSNYTNEESVNEKNEDDDSTDWIDEIDENITLPFQIEEKKIKEHNEIYLENLHPEVDEDILSEIFKQFGDIISIRLMRDPDTQQSLEIAYVTYINHSAAKSAFEQVNFKNIYGRKCLIKWSESDKAVRKSTEGNIFIKNLDLAIDTEQLYHLFKSFGEIVSCKVQANEDGMSQGFAFVRYNSKENAAKAIAEMNGKLIKDKSIYVGKFLSKTQRKKEPKEKEFTNCYVNNFGTLLNDRSLREMFEVFGKIKSSKVEIDENGISKGFGFVSFFKHCDAAEAVKTLNGKIIENKMIYVGRAMKKSERKNRNDLQGDMKNNIYINLLNKNIDDERLRDLFSEFGPIKSAKVMRNEDNTSLGYGFVCFHDPRDAATAIEKMNRKIIDGQRIYVNLCQKQSDKNQSVRNVKTCLENSNFNSNVSDQKFLHLMTSQNQNVPFLQNPLVTNSVFQQMLPPMIITNQMSGSNNIKDYYGNILFPRVKFHAGNLAGKIVGMILNLDNSQIINLINNENALLAKIKEAVNLLNARGNTG